MRSKKIATYAIRLILVSSTIAHLTLSKSHASQPGYNRPYPAQGLPAAIDQLLKIDPLFCDPPLPSRFSCRIPSEEAEKPLAEPADNAPMKDLISYWQYRIDDGSVKPSGAVRRRLLEAVEKAPRLF